MSLPDTAQDLNYFEIDRNLHRALEALQPDQFSRWRGALSDFGQWAGGALDEEATYTDRHARPQLVPYDGEGRLVNHVQYNPLWEQASREIYARGIVGLNYTEAPASYLITFAMGYLTAQSDVSLLCPVAMTGAVAHILNRFAPESIREIYLPQLTRMDGGALSAGTWATEQHGGSDIGATTTVAHAEDGHWLLNGLKWFTSNVDGGIAVATARPENARQGSRGLGLYLVPSLLPSGGPNPMRIRRLKDKLGTCGIATAEVDLTDTFGLEIAPPPQGFKLMMEALEFSRIQNAMGAAGLQRRAFLESLCFAANRQAFGDVITAFPMVQHELIQMRVELEADLALALQAAHAFDQAWAAPLHEGPVAERTWLRLVTALAKYQTAETANRTCRAAIELIGGNGYTYDFVTPRLLRDAQVLSVWEGPANVQALEVLRLLAGRYGGFELFSARISAITEAASELPELVGILRVALAECAEAAKFVASSPDEAARHARRLMAFMARLLAAALLLEQAAAEVEAGDDRKALVARAYIERHLAPRPRRGIGEDSNWLYAAFDRFMALDREALA